MALLKCGDWPVFGRLLTLNCGTLVVTLLCPRLLSVPLLVLSKLSSALEFSFATLAIEPLDLLRWCRLDASHVNIFPYQEHNSSPFYVDEVKGIIYSVVVTPVHVVSVREPVMHPDYMNFFPHCWHDRQVAVLALAQPVHCR